MTRAMGSGVKAHCPQCEPKAPCTFHAAKTPVELGKAFFQRMRNEGSLALADLLLAALANLEGMLPPGVLDALGAMDPGALQEEFNTLLEAEGFDTDDLRELAACALALALMTERKGKEHGARNPKK